jgi:hypothetical protein
MCQSWHAYSATLTMLLTDPADVEHFSISKPINVYLLGLTIGQVLSVLMQVEPSRVRVVEYLLLLTADVAFLQAERQKEGQEPE